MAAVVGDLPVLVSINHPVKSILKELLRTAQRRKSGSYSVLLEAYSSLKACPLSFTSIDQLLPLGGFGPALVDKIEMLLCQWCEEHGKRYVKVQSSKAAIQKDVEVFDEHELGEDDVETDSDLDTKAPSKRAKAQPKMKTTTLAEPRKSKKAAIEKEPKVFIPQHRSGTHGILVALFTLTPGMPIEEEVEMESEAGIHYYSKSTVIQFAQPYSNSSYVPKETSAPGSGYGTFHSAWSAMKILINRAYVYRRGNPARFGLSRQGWKVAQTCAEREKDLHAGCNQDKVGQSINTIIEPSKEKEKKRKKKGIIDEDIPGEQSSANLSAPFLYTYLDDNHPPQQTTMKSAASVRLSDKDYRMLYKITFSKQLTQHAFVKSCVENICEEGELIVGWVKEAVCNEVAPGIPFEESIAAGSCSTSPIITKPIITTPIITKPITTKERKKQQPHNSITDMQTSSETCKKALQMHISNSQANVIDLLTSSDVELEALPRLISVKSKPPRRKQRSSSSDSELSDLAPIVKQKKKIAKVNK